MLNASRVPGAEVADLVSSAPPALGLLGEVRIAKDDDYEKWGIGIWVRFRDPKDKSGDVELHELSGHRQSGGVRSFVFASLACGTITNSRYGRNRNVL